MLIPTILSIALVYAVVSLINQRQERKFCPICVAVSFTWLWLLILYMRGYHYDALLVGILMGGSVVGIMYQLQRTIWAHLYAVLGFFAVYMLLKEQWGIFAALGVFAGALALWQRVKPARTNNELHSTSAPEEKAAEIEKKLEECCP